MYRRLGGLFRSIINCIKFSSVILLTVLLDSVVFSYICLVKFTLWCNNKLSIIGKPFEQINKYMCKSESIITYTYLISYYISTFLVSKIGFLRIFEHKRSEKNVGAGMRSYLIFNIFYTVHEKKVILIQKVGIFFWVFRSLNEFFYIRYFLFVFQDDFFQFFFRLFFSDFFFHLIFLENNTELYISL